LGSRRKLKGNSPPTKKPTSQSGLRLDQGQRKEKPERSEDFKKKKSPPSPGAGKSLKPKKGPHFRHNKLWLKYETKNRGGNAHEEKNNREGAIFGGAKRDKLLMAKGRKGTLSRSAGKDRWEENGGAKSHEKKGPPRKVSVWALRKTHTTKKKGDSEESVISQKTIKRE